MNNFKFTFYIPFYFISALTSCIYNTTTDTMKLSIQTIKIGIDKKCDLTYWDIIDSVWYVPLETKEESLLGKISDYKILDSLVYIRNFDRNELAIFDIYDGRFINKINSVGDGPCEYRSITSYTVNNEGYIEILDYRSNMIYAYNIWGNFQSKRKFLIGATRRFCHVINDIYIYTTNRESLNNTFYEGYSAYIMSGNDKIIGKYLPIDKNLIGLQIEDTQLWKINKKTVVFAQSFNDTIYHVNKHGLLPKYFIDFQKNKRPKNYFSDFNSIESQERLKKLNAMKYSNFVGSIVNYFESDELIYFEFLTNGKLYKVFVKKDDYYPIILFDFDNRFSLAKPRGLLDNILISVIYPYQLYIYWDDFLNSSENNDNEYFKILKELRSKIKYSDNPILLFQRIK